MHHEGGAHALGDARLIPAGGSTGADHRTGAAATDIVGQDVVLAQRPGVECIDDVQALRAGRSRGPSVVDGVFGELEPAKIRIAQIADDLISSAMVGPTFWVLSTV